MKTIQMLQSEGVTVEVSKLDVAVTQPGASSSSADCQRLAPIGGIFHLAMILEDRLILKHVRPWLFSSSTYTSLISALPAHVCWDTPPYLKQR